jgi:hypothetical protein
MSAQNNGGDINVSFRMNSRKLKSIGGAVGVTIAVVALVVALVISFSASRRASANQVLLVAALADLTNKEISIENNAATSENIRTAFNSAQSDLTASQSTVQTSLAALGVSRDDLKKSLAATESSLATTNESLTQAKDDINSQVDSIKDVNRSLGALDNTFDQTRDIANANKKQLADDDTLNNYLFVEAAFSLWNDRWGTPLVTWSQWDIFMENAVRETADTQLISAWNAVQISWDKWVALDITTYKNEFYAAEADFLWRLGEKINSARS